MLIGLIPNHNRTEVGQPCLWTDGSKFGIIHDNFVTGELVRPGFYPGKIMVESGAGMLRCIAWRFRHPLIVTSPRCDGSDRFDGVRSAPVASNLISLVPDPCICPPRSG